MKERRFFKRISVLFACVSTLCFAFSGAACGNSGENTSGESWYAEKSGYKFCGYYEDADFTKPISGTVTEKTAKNYYAKYQIDKVQQLACTPTEFENVIYATDFQQALDFYLTQSYAVIQKSESQFGMISYEWFGIPYNIGEIYENEMERGLYELTDSGETVPYDYRNRYIPHYKQYNGGNMYQRTNEWKVYLGERKESQDGWVYSVVENSFAVIYGRTESGVEYTEELKIPSEIEGYPVKEVSVAPKTMWNFSTTSNFIPKTIGTLTVPSSVENFVWYSNNMQVGSAYIKNLIFEEGIKTICMTSGIAENVSIPASAYFVDFNGMDGMKADVKDETITVANGGHYYTKNGCLYSKERDLCYQFANKNKLDLHVDSNTKRVLPMSFTGIAKNIYLPESVEYFDWNAFYNTYRRSYFEIKQPSDAPLLFVDGEKAAKRLLEDILFDMENEDNNFPIILYNNDLNVVKLSESFSTSYQAVNSGIDGYSAFGKELTSPYFTVNGNEVYRAGQTQVYTYLNGQTFTEYTFDKCVEAYYSNMEN